MKRLMALLFSLAVLALIYSRLDLARLAGVFRETHAGWLIAGLAMVVPTTGLTAWRLKVLAPQRIHMRLRDAVSLTLSASVLNMVLPSKMGDLAKAYFIRDRDAASAPVAVPLVVFEKTCDLLALLAWCALGLLLLPKGDWYLTPLSIGVAVTFAAGCLILVSRPLASRVFSTLGRRLPGSLGRKTGALGDAWDQMHGYFWGHRGRLALVIAVSLGVWLLHLIQIWMFIIALRRPCGLLTSLGLTSLSIFAGLLPLTLAGIGTRDAALIFFYRDVMPAELGAALGLLCTLRYVMPAIGGLPVFARAMAMVRSGGRGREIVPS